MNAYNRRDNSFSHSEEDNQRQVTDLTLEVIIVLGAPSKDCQFHGICRIEPLDQLTKAPPDLPENGVLARFCKDQLTKELTIQFRRESMTTFVYQKYFQTDVFMIPESVELPDFVSGFFRESYTIKEGKYLLKKGLTFYEIVLSKTRSKS